MIERVYLVGFMGAGKTEVGKALAAKLDWRFIDLDRQIERREEKNVARIFEESGEARFRTLESIVLREAARERSVVVATGGGTWMIEENRIVIETTGTAIWLEASLETLWNRAAVSVRPLAVSKTDFQDLYESRVSLYRKVRLRVGNDRVEVPKVVDRILQKLRLNPPQNRS